MAARHARRARRQGRWSTRQDHAVAPRDVLHGVGYRPHTVQRVALGAAKDGRSRASSTTAPRRPRAYEQFSEALVSAGRVLHACPNVHTRQRLAPMNVDTPTFMRAPGEVSGVFALRIRHGRARGRARHGSGRAAAAQRARTGRGQELPFSSRSSRECYRVAAERSAGAAAIRSRARCAMAAG